MTSYPIDAILPQLKEAVSRHPVVILQAPPGAGKTTRVPIALLDILRSEAGRIIMLEPRRLAAVSAARWMAQSLGEPIGETIGYSIRFDTKTSARTRIEVVTEGILTRRMQSDPGLASAALVVFDEFHERSIHADLALALCLDVQSGLRQDLKVLIMSATLDSAPLAALLGGAPVIASTGKAFPVEERYVEDRSGPLPQRVAAAIRTALRRTNGDILVFLPGAGEIRACEQELRASLNLAEERLALHPLYGDLPFEDQERAILPSRDHRKIVLATNIAETSLTIEGVQVVIDSGLTRRLQYDPSTGMNRLVTIELSRASAEQRKGRAGRLGPGVCYRLYNQFALKGMQAFIQPEVLGSDLAPLVLELAVWGVTDPEKLTWLDVPPAAAWKAGRQLLIDLGALDRTGSATVLGRAMARFPLHPRLSRLLLRSQELGCASLGIELAAILSERDLVRKNAAGGSGKEPDVAERVALLRQWRNGKEVVAGADPAALRAVDRTAKQLQRLLPDPRNASAQQGVDPVALSRLLLAAYPDRVAQRRDEGGRVYVLAQGRGIRLSMDSHLVNDPFLIAVQVDAGVKAEGVVHLAAPVTEEVVRSECAARIQSVRRVEWDRSQGRIVAAIEERLDAMLLDRKSVV
jgi:ATP-dependent helicase HrpB